MDTRHRLARALRRPLLLLAAALLATAGTAACGAQVQGAADYSVSAQENYKRGEQELEEKDWVAAAKYFSFIKSRFPYSKYAVLAELRIADAELGAEQHLQAIDSYKLFIQFHPTHEMVANGYASFRIGEAYVEMLPGDVWILPPSYEKDQSTTYDAERTLRTFLEQYPDSPYAGRAKELHRKVAARLARHEWYVANFYWERGKPMGTVLRLRRLLDRYAGTEYDAEALWLLGRAYVKLNMSDRARNTWQKLIDEHPTHDRAGEARTALSQTASRAQPSTSNQ